MENLSTIDSSCIPNDVHYFDMYGFAVFKDGCVVDLSEAQRCHEYRLPQLSEAQLDTWADMLRNWEHTWTHSSNKLRNFIKRGVPNGIRGVLWKNLLESDKIKNTSDFQYKDNLLLVRSQLVDLGVSEYGDSKSATELHSDEFIEEHKDQVYDIKTNNKVPITVLRQIFLDVERTFPTHQMFMSRVAEAKEGRACLFRVLSVYARYNPQIGYCQGMSYIAAMFLMHMNEESAFWAMVSMLERPKYLYGYFEDNMKRLQVHAEILHRLLQQRLPKLAYRLECQGMQPLMYVTQWFLCLYTSLACWDTTLAVWDLLLLDGITVLFRAGLAILQVFEEDLLKTSGMNSALPKLLRPPVEVVNYDVLTSAMWNIDVHKWEIDTLLAVVEEEEHKLRKPGNKRHLPNNQDEQTPQVHKKRKIPEQEETTFFSKFVNIFTPTPQREPKKNIKQPKVHFKTIPGRAQSTLSSANQSGTRTHSYYLRHRYNLSGHRMQHQYKSISQSEDSEDGGNSCDVQEDLQSLDDVWHLSPCEVAMENSFISPMPTPPVHGRNTLVAHRRLSTKHVTLSPITPSTSHRRSPRLANINQTKLSNIHVHQQTSQNIMNIPSTRKIVSSRAKTQYSFKSFHTPTPMRKSQILKENADNSITLSSPEVELKPMESKVSYKKTSQLNTLSSPILENHRHLSK